MAADPAEAVAAVERMDLNEVGPGEQVVDGDVVGDKQDPTVSPAGAGSVEASANEESPVVADPIENVDDSSSTTSLDSEVTPPLEDAVTTTEEAEAKLLEATQQKDEGNTHFKAGDWEKASRCYRRGCNILKPLRKTSHFDREPQIKALMVALHSNLSTSCFKQSKFKATVDVATQALVHEPTNVKLLYRRALAYRQMGDYEAAREDLKNALQQDPNNKDCKKELALVKKGLEQSRASQKKALAKAFSAKGGSFLYEDKEEEIRKKERQAKEEKERQEELLKKRKMQWEDECVKRMANSEAAISFEEWEKEQEEAEKKKRKEEEKKRKEERKLRAKSSTDSMKVSGSDSDDDELTADELAKMRGYKKTADGRTTSYFTRELSDDAKKAIGDIAPKRLDAAPTPTSVTAPINASAWNAAGTWEEKDTTEWCKSQLTTRLCETATTAVDLKEGYSLRSRISKVEELTGDASVAFAAGKKRYIFDFHAKLKYQILDEMNDNGVVAKGNVALPDICSTHHDELEVTFGPWKKPPSTVLENTCLEIRQALAQQLRLAVQQWVQDFNMQY